MWPGAAICAPAALPTVSRAPNAAVAKYIALLRFIAFLPFEGKLSTTLPVLQHLFWRDGRAAPGRGLCGLLRGPIPTPSHQGRKLAGRHRCVLKRAAGEVEDNAFAADRRAAVDREEGGGRR